MCSARKYGQSFATKVSLQEKDIRSPLCGARHYLHGTIAAVSAFEHAKNEKQKTFRPDMMQLPVVVNKRIRQEHCFFLYPDHSFGASLLTRRG